MANFKRKKCRRQVRCGVCTQWRWVGNISWRHAKQVKRHNSRGRWWKHGDPA